MPPSRPNLRKDPSNFDLSKSSFDLSKPGELQNFALERKPEGTRPITGVGVIRELGTVAGFDIEARARADISNIIPQQGITIDRDVTKNSLIIGANAGTTRGKLGLSIGAEIQGNADGTNTIRGLSGGINVAGFGVAGRAGRDGAIGGEISALGITIDIARDAKGGVSGGISVRLPGGEIGISIQSDEGIEVPGEIDTPTPPEPEPVIDTQEEPPTPNGVTPPQGQPIIPIIIPPIRTPIEIGWINEPIITKTCKVVIKVELKHRWYFNTFGSQYGEIINNTIAITGNSGSTAENMSPGGILNITYRNKRTHWNLYELDYNYQQNSEKQSTYKLPYVGQQSSRYTMVNKPGVTCQVGRVFDSSGNNQSFAQVLEGQESAIYDYISRTYQRREKRRFIKIENGFFRIYADIPTLLRTGDPTNIVDPKIKYPGYNLDPDDKGYDTYDYIVTFLETSCSMPELKPPVVKPPPPALVKKIQLPNPPQYTKKMDCCNLVKELHEFLGIAKFKKNGFVMSDAFGVPGAQGDTRHKDLYDVLEAIVLMNANGMIFNPISKPLGSGYQNVNATSWAAEIYEMIAEAKSDGNSTQVFELHAGFQLVQMMKVMAELTRKVECLSEMLGYTPQLATEEIPVMFTIYEKHKGFGKDQKPKEIDITKAKTDADVEKILGQMLKPSLVPITKWVFDPNHKSINAALSTM